MRKILAISSVAAIAAGALLAAAGAWGAFFTYRSVAREKIVTPDDARIPNRPVRGPLTLKAQADIIRLHTLESTGGKTFAEMPRQIPQLDESGRPVINASGTPVMVANAARDIWITATALTTALTMAILAYGFSAFAALFGLILLWAGILLRVSLRRGDFIQP